MQLSKLALDIGETIFIILQNEDIASYPFPTSLNANAAQKIHLKVLLASYILFCSFSWHKKSARKPTVLTLYNQEEQKPSLHLRVYHCINISWTMSIRAGNNWFFTHFFFHCWLILRIVGLE